MTHDSIKKDLLELGARASLKGLNCTARAIELYHTGCRITNDNGIYGIIAKENNDTQSRVERAIRHMIHEMHGRVGKEELMKRISGKYGIKLYTADWEKPPSNSEFIAVIKLGIEGGAHGV